MPFLVALEARPSSLGGNGLFAVNDIPAETKLWVMKPKEGDTVRLAPIRRLCMCPAVEEPFV